jgi:hypothetical protein
MPEPYGMPVGVDDAKKAAAAALAEARNSGGWPRRSWTRAATSSISRRWTARRQAASPWP